MSDKFTYTKVLGAARRSLDIIDVSKILEFTSSLVSPSGSVTHECCIHTCLHAKAALLLRQQLTSQVHMHSLGLAPKTVQ